MDILFIGGVFPKESEQDILRKCKGIIQFAANTFQWNLINGLDNCNNKPIKILNSLFVGSFPKLYNDIYIKYFNWKHSQTTDDINIGFLNIFGIKHIWKSLALRSKIKKWANLNINENKTVIVYSMHTPFLFAASYAKKKNKEIKLCLIAPDLPEYMSVSEKKSVLFKILKFMDRKVMNHYLKKVDNFIFLTKYMADRIKTGQKKWAVVEGFANPDESINSDELKNDIFTSKNRNILYTGTLRKAYGIIELLNAFSLINDTAYRLWICGDGNAREEVENAAEHDKRIVYLGQVPRNEALKLQKNATALINPRGGEDDYTKYSFPSKIIEYMSSGTPVIMKKLPGIPNEYYEYCYTIDSGSVREMADKIIEVCNLPDDTLIDFGTKAKEFILNEKNYIKQAKKIFDLIN